HKSITEEHPGAKSARPASAAPTARPAKTEVPDGFAFRLSAQLVSDGLRAGVDKALDRFGRLKESSRTPKTRTFAAIAGTWPRAACALAAGPGPLEGATKTGRGNWLTRDHFVEARQFLVRFLLHPGSNRRANFLHLLTEAVRFENRLAEFVQLRKVEFFEGVDFKNPFQEPVLAAPRTVDAQVLALVPASHHPELTERMVKVPRHELKLPRFRMQINVVVLARAQNAVHGG